MYFDFTFGTIILFIIGVLFILVVRVICQKDVIGEKIGLIDKYMLVSLFVHIIWATLVDICSHYGYQYLVWDDETYHGFAMGTINDMSLYGTNLYYGLLRVLYSVFGKTTVTGRLTNLFFSVATIYPLSTIEYRLNSETKYSATRFFAYSPFMIFISYFEIKDIMLLFFFVSAYALVKRLTEEINVLYLLLLVAICVLNERFRSGSGVLPIAVLILSRIRGLGSNKVQKRLFIAISTVIVIAVALYIGQDYLQYGIYRIDRYQNWILRQFSESSIYNKFVITKITDIWKFPFCFLLYSLQPLDMLLGNMRFYSEFGMIAKIVDVPVLFFSILFLPAFVKKEKWNSLFFLIFYAFNSCINLTNARQGFFLYPIMYLMFYDSFLTIKQNDHEDGVRTIYRNEHNWRLFVNLFYIVWVLFVLYRFIH